MQAICAAITPFDENGDLDADGLRPLFESIRSSGMDHVFAAGTTGEFTALTDEERLTVLTAALEVFGSEGVYAHIGAASTRQAARLARAAYQAGARRLAAITPYYVTAGPVSTVQHFRALTEAVPHAEVFAYVFPQRATTDVSPQTLAEIAALPGMAGAKLSGRSTAELKPYLAAVPDDFAMFSGADREVIDLAAAGCAGIVSGVSSVFPEPFVRAVSMINSGTDPSSCQPDIEKAVAALGGGDMHLVKAGVGYRGLPSGAPRVSTDPPSEKDLAALREAVAAARR